MVLILFKTQFLDWESTWSIVKESFLITKFSIPASIKAFKNNRNGVVEASASG